MTQVDLALQDEYEGQQYGIAQCCPSSCTWVIHCPTGLYLFAHSRWKPPPQPRGLGTWWWKLAARQTSLAFPRLRGLMETCQTRTLLFRTQLMPSACVSDVQNPIVWRTSSQRVMTAPKHCLVLATFVMRPWRGMKSLKDLGWRQVLTKTFPCYGLAWTSSATTTTGLDGVSASIVPRLSEFRQQWCGCLYRYRTCAGWTEYFASGKGTCSSNSKTYKSVWIWVKWFLRWACLERRCCLAWGIGAMIFWWFGKGNYVNWGVDVWLEFGCWMYFKWGLWPPDFADFQDSKPGVFWVLDVDWTGGRQSTRRWVFSLHGCYSGGRRLRG